MKHILTLIAIVLSAIVHSQNITVDSQTYSPQQLIEDILIDSDCIENVVVTNVVGGNFNGADQSYGFFDATGTNFPFQSGIVLSTGRLSNVPGPNNNLSDDNATNWLGDNDLETVLNESNTTNATIIEFDFTSIATQVSFRYLFASEEYQENNANTCQFSDLFGFLIRPAAATQAPYTNIALVPNTNTPVKVTTVSSGIPGACPPINETYFEGYNGTNAPINFNGQTTVLTATADVMPNEVYHVKLVIADEQNFRFDSAVFLEAGSFQLSTDLGPNRLIATNNAVCEGDTLTLNAFQNNASYLWSFNGIPDTPAPCNDCPQYEVSMPGTYNVEVYLDNNCISYGEIIVEYTPLPVVSNAILAECDDNTDGLTTFNLNNAANQLTNGNNALSVSAFYLSEADALANTDAINGITNFQNTVPFQTVYARVVNDNNCFDIAEVELQALTSTTISIPPLEACDGDVIDGFASFNLNDISNTLQNVVPADAVIRYYETETDAINAQNPLPNTYENTTPDTQTLFVRILSSTACFAITTVNLNVLYTPVLEADESILYCLNTFPETITLFGGVLNDLPNNYYYEWLFNGVTTEVTTTFNEINEPGIYTVIVTDPNGCSSRRTITVNASDIAVIEDVTVEGIDLNNTVTVNVTGEGFYDYALDDPDGFYQESNVFTNLSRGFHTVYVRDRNGCGIISYTFSVIGFPKFFTPNGDGDNDTWRISGGGTSFNDRANLQIFNRYGKLITQLNAFNGGWDGTLNGNRLPSDDYWFVITFLDGRTYTGHFALRR